jgi:hypothetical protein
MKLGVLHILMLWFGNMIPTDGKKGSTNLVYSHHLRERNTISPVVVVTIIRVLTQGQALQTKYHTSEIFKSQTANADCVQQFDKTIDRIISACPVLAKEHCIKICSSVCSSNCTFPHAKKQG